MAAPKFGYQDPFGDESRVEVGVVLDSLQVGGFSVQLEPPKLVFLPLLLK